jgi:hypothetical protein
MIYQGKKVVCLEVSATGHRSGAFRSHLFFMTEDDFNKHEDVLREYRFWFHDLDGKHSEIEGDVKVHYDDNAIGQAYHLSTDGDEKWVDCVNDVLPKDDVPALREFNDTIWQGLVETKVVKVNFFDQVIYEE